jgi:beta-phosphoglucomutase family hydrolase
MTGDIAFIFDMDGTIVDNMRVHNQTWQTVLADEGVQIEIDEFNRQTTGKKTPEILRLYLGERATGQEIARISDKKESIYRRVFRPYLRAIAGLPGFLAQARRLHIPVALATSAGKVNIEYILSGTGLKPYFDVRVSGEEVVQGKPHPEIFLVAAQRLGILPQRCVVFEDSLLGVEAACRAGMKAIAITTSIPAKDFEGVCPVLEIAGDFLDLQPGQVIQLFFERDGGTLPAGG